MKVQIRQSFCAPPAATFLVGEVLDVPEAMAQEWIDAGRAVLAGSVGRCVNRPSLFDTAPPTRKELADKARLEAEEHNTVGNNVHKKVNRISQAIIKKSLKRKYTKHS